jgi:hypothetical protein
MSMAWIIKFKGAIRKDRPLYEKYFLCPENIFNFLGNATYRIMIPLGRAFLKNSRRDLWKGVIKENSFLSSAVGWG